MAEDQNNNNNTTDSTSFASILAGVKRLREQNGATENQSVIPPPQPNQRPLEPRLPGATDRAFQIEPQSNLVPSKSEKVYESRGTKRVNAFNQEKTYDPKERDVNNSTFIKPSTISVNKSQKGNPLLQNLTNVNYVFVEARNPFDYLVRNRDIIFLSLKYHKLHPEYISNKMKPLVKRSAILLTVVDVENNENIIREINRLCLYNDFTLLLAFSFEQAAKYLTYLATTKTKTSS